MTEQSEPVQSSQAPMPDQPPEDVLKRLSGIPKTAEELEAEREAVEEERRTRFAQTARPAAEQAAATNENQPLPPQPEPMPEPQTEPGPEAEPEPTP